MTRPYVYRPVYQNAPMEEIGKLFENTEKSFVENRDNYTKLSAALSSIKGNDSDNEYIKSIADKYNSEIEKLSETVQKRKDWSQADDIIRNMAMSLASDQKLGAIKESYANYLDEEKRRQDFMAKGIPTLDFSDYANHKNWDENGKVNIYRSKIEPKADYYKTISEMWSAVKPDLEQSGFEKSKLPFYLESETTVSNVPKIKALQDTVVNNFKNDAAGQQFIRKLKLERPDITEAEINHAVKEYVRDVSRLYESSQTKIDYQVDKQQEIEYRTQQSVEAYRQKQQIKAALKSNNTDDEGNHKLVAIQAHNLNKEGDLFGASAMINNATVARNIKDTYLGGAVDISNVKLLEPDKSAKEVFEGGFGEIQPIGFNIINVTGDKSYDGSLVADVKDKNGMNHRVLIKMDDASPYKQMTRTATTMNSYITHDYGSLPRVNMPDDSGLIRVRDSQGNEVNIETGFEIVSDDKKNWKKSNKKLIPQYRGEDGKWYRFTQAELDRSFIKPSYTPNEILQETSNMIGVSLKPMVYSAKTITDQ